MFDINEAFIQALQEQELKEGLDYGDESINITTSGDDEEARKHYGKDMTKRNRVRSLDQAKRNLKRAATDGRIGDGQIVDQISFEDTLNRDLDNYKYKKDMAAIYSGKEPKYNKDLRIDDKSKLEPSEHNEMVATMWDIEANDVADKIRAKHNKKEAIDYKNDKYTATTAEDTNDERAYYGKHMTKRDKVRSLKQAQRNLDRIGNDTRVTQGQAVDQISFEDTLNTDLARYKNNREWAKKSAEKGDEFWANEHNKQANKFADKIRAKHNKKQENASITVTQDVNNEDEALDLVNDTSYFNIGDEVEVKDWNGRTYKVTKTKDYKYKDGKRIEEELEENNEKTKLTFAYKDNGQFYYKDEKGKVYVDTTDTKDKVDLYRCVGEYDEPEISVNADDYELINNPKDNVNYERNRNYEFDYMMLSRLVQDCKYFLGNGNRYVGNLWGDTVDDHIAEMKKLYNKFPDDMKPEWLSMEDIENYEKEMKSEKKTEAEETGDNVSFELNTDLLPILNMSQYNLADDIDISREELNNVMSDLGKPIIEKVIKEILPNATVTAGEFYNPKYYNYDVDQLDFTVSVPKSDYETLKNDTLSKEDFEQFLQKTYKSYDGYTSTMPKNIAEFNKAKDWEQFVAILSYYIKPFVHQEEFSMEVLDYIWENFPTEVDEEENENIEESKEPLKETDKDMYEKIKSEPRTEKYKDGLKLKDEIVEAWKNKDLDTASNKWNELFNMFSTGYDDNGNKTEDFSEEQAIRDMIELTMITDEIEDKCVYDVTDYGKQKYYTQMGYNQ